MNKKDKTILLGIVSVVITIVISVVFSRNIKHLKKYGYLGVFLFCLIGNATMLSPAGPIITLFAGRVYNPIVVGLVGALGCVLGEYLAYNIGAVAGTMNLQNHNWYMFIKKFFDSNGFLTIIAITSIPNPVLNFGSAMAGALQYPLWLDLIASYIGNSIQFTITASLGTLSKKIKFLK
jgi:uncharacterized membrane protein YdjX (TVP38/TMEM64 family)